jgi:hypothetical protein
LYASPAHALNLLRENADLNRAPLQIRDEKSGSFAEKSSDCLKNLDLMNYPARSDVLLACEGAVLLNEAYEQKIQNSLKIIVDAVAKRTNCETIQTAPVPELFLSGGPPTVTLFSPSAVNLLALDGFVIAAKQPNAVFEEDMRKTFSQNHLEVEFIDAHMLNNYDGGIHCATNVLRKCSQ